MARNQPRNYAPIIDALDAAITPETEYLDAMQQVVDLLWDAFSEDGYSWVGFYVADEAKPESERLILGPRRDKPACSPIGLSGVCGAAYTSGRVQIIDDVRTLGDNYVACDPRDLSEIVLPLFHELSSDHRCWAVLDVDSWETGAFDASDRNGLAQVLEAAGFHVTPAVSGA